MPLTVTSVATAAGPDDGKPLFSKETAQCERSRISDESCITFADMLATPIKNEPAMNGKRQFARKPRRIRRARPANPSQMAQAEISSSFRPAN